MFNEKVVPLLRSEFPLKEPFVCRTFRTIGIGESSVQEKIARPLEALRRAGLEIGYCAHMGQVDVRLSYTDERGQKLIEEAGNIVRKQFGPAIFTEGDDDLETVVIGLLAKKKQTLALAESCTGGGIADRLTNVPGASAVFMGGFVTYSNALKEKILGVRSATLAQYGAVSEGVAREMAEGVRRVAGSNYGISVTGIAGPSGGTDEKPVGTVFIGLASEKGTNVLKMFNPWDRIAFKEVTARQALNQLRLRLLGE